MRVAIMPPTMEGERQLRGKGRLACFYTGDQQERINGFWNITNMWIVAEVR